MTNGGRFSTNRTVSTATVSERRQRRVGEVVDAPVAIHDVTVLDGRRPLIP